MEATDLQAALNTARHTRLRRSYRQAYFIRRRFTILDFIAIWGLTDSLLDGLFAPGGCWSPALATVGSIRR